MLWAYAARQPQGFVTVDEVIPPGEAETTVRLVRAATQSLDDEARGDRLYKRDAHAQPHGCVRATVDVAADLGPRYRHGVFAEPGRRWNAWVRFSNGTQSDDTQPDARGMAIKLLDVPGPKLLSCAEDPEQSTQDFVMVNYHTFFLRNAGEYETFFAYQKRNQPIAYFFAGWPPAWKLRPLYHGAHMLFQRVPSPLATRYYTMSAYRFGPQNAKLSAQPCVMPDIPMPRPRTAHYLRDALVRGLRTEPACFRLLVQLQDPARNMPIEDPTIQWDERESPYVPVATLTIPRAGVQHRRAEPLLRAAVVRSLARAAGASAGGRAQSHPALPSIARCRAAGTCATTCRAARRTAGTCAFGAVVRTRADEPPVTPP